METHGPERCDDDGPPGVAAVWSKCAGGHRVGTVRRSTSWTRTPATTCGQSPTGANPSAAELLGVLPAALIPTGATYIGDAPCDIRIARGTTDVQTIMLPAGRIWIDAAFVDQPAAGTHTYSLQMRTSDPATVCTAYLGNGAVPMPSMLVQVFYGS